MNIRILIRSALVATVAVMPLKAEVPVAADAIKITLQDKSDPGTVKNRVAQFVQNHKRLLTAMLATAGGVVAVIGGASAVMYVRSLHATSQDLQQNPSNEHDNATVSVQPDLTENDRFSQTTQEGVSTELPVDANWQEEAKATNQATGDGNEHVRSFVGEQGDVLPPVPEATDSAPEIVAQPRDQGDEPAIGMPAVDHGADACPAVHEDVPTVSTDVEQPIGKEKKNKHKHKRPKNNNSLSTAKRSKLTFTLGQIRSGEMDAKLKLSEKKNNAQ